MLCPRIVPLLLSIIVASIVADATSAAADPSSVERWKGVITMAPMKLEFLVVLEDGRGHITIPQQGVSQATLEEVDRREGKLHFTFAPREAPFEARFELAVDESGETATGKLTQGGVVCDVEMERVENDIEVGPRRPQTPEPPFPYEERPVVVEHGDPEVTLTGTLTVPEGEGPHPGAILITGSGPQDRDETIAGHKPFWVIADHLTRRGIAVLRLDDRGVGGSSGTVMESTTAEFVEDIRAAYHHLRTIGVIDGDRVGLIGHSEGGMIAPRVAREEVELAFIVLLAGPGLPGDELLPVQLAATLRASGVPEESIAKQVAAQKKILVNLTSNGSKDELRAAMTELVQLQTGVEDPNDPLVVSQVNAQIQAFDSPWFRSFLQIDPLEALRQVRCPVLALNGELDLQVPPEENLPRIEKALTEAETDDVTVRSLAGLNHLFQTAKTGLPAEYMTIEETFAPKALETITTWLLERVGRDEGNGTRN